MVESSNRLGVKQEPNEVIVDVEALNSLGILTPTTMTTFEESLGHPIHSRMPFVTNAGAGHFMSRPVREEEDSVSSQDDPDPEWMPRRGMGTSTRAAKRAHSQSRSVDSGDNSDVKEYGPIKVRSRKRPAPTLSTGRRSKDERLHPEEDERRRVRRERNKVAAAKCRRQRQDVQSTLEKEMKVINDSSNKLQNEINHLEKRREEMEYILSSHKASCRLCVSVSSSKPSQPRPNTLPLLSGLHDSMQTPSLPSFGLELHSGFTPIIASPMFAMTPNLCSPSDLGKGSLSEL